MVTISMELGNAFTAKCRKLKEQIPKCYYRALGEAAKKGKSAFEDSKGGAPSIYNMKKADLSKYTRILKDGIRVRSSLFTIGTTTHFSHTPKAYQSQKGIPVKRRKRMTATIKKKNRKKFPHGFIANPAKVGKTMMWERLHGSRKIAPIRTISAAQMASNEKVHPYVEEKMLEVLEKRFEHHFNRIKV